MVLSQMEPSVLRSGGHLCVRNHGDPPPFYFEGFLVLMPSSAFGSSTTLYIYGHVAYDTQPKQKFPFSARFSLGSSLLYRPPSVIQNWWSSSIPGVQLFLCPLPVGFHNADLLCLGV